MGFKETNPSPPQVTQDDAILKCANCQCQIYAKKTAVCVCLRYVSAASLKCHATPSQKKSPNKTENLCAKEPIRIRSVNYFRLNSQQKTEYFSSLKVRLSFILVSCGSAAHQDGKRVYDLKIFLKLFNGLSGFSRTIICRKWSNSQSTMEAKISHQTSSICSLGRSYLAIEILVLRNANA